MPDLTRQIPSSLEAHARRARLGARSEIPVMQVHPTWREGDLAPIVLWMHGRTVNKELDPGRYLRWMRAGIGACAIDLPGHGERSDPEMQQPERAFEVLKQMLVEIDVIVASIERDYAEFFDPARIGIGGMSIGGMTGIARLTRPHQFVCASIEATTGSWRHQLGRKMFSLCEECDVDELDPIQHLDPWREIPFQAFHTKADEWVRFEGQQEFIAALRARYENPDLIEFITFERTGAPFEHAGFGRFSAEAKDRQTRFFARCLATS